MFKKVPHSDSLNLLLGSTTSSRVRRLRRNEPCNSGSSKQFVETFVSAPAASFPPNAAQVPTVPPPQYYQVYGATAVPSASTQYTAYTVPHTHGYGISGAVPNSPHYATSPPNPFSDNLHPQSVYHPVIGQYTTSAVQSQIPVATSKTCDTMSSSKFAGIPAHRSMQRGQSEEPSLVPKCEKSDLSQQHRRTSCTSDSAAGNMQQSERLVSESSEDRSEPRQPQAQQNKRFQRESTFGTTSNTCSSGKVSHPTKIIRGNCVSFAVY